MYKNMILTNKYSGTPRTKQITKTRKEQPYRSDKLSFQHKANSSNHPIQHFVGKMPRWHCSALFSSRSKKEPVYS